MDGGSVLQPQKALPPSPHPAIGVKQEFMSSFPSPLPENDDVVESYADLTRAAARPSP
jgi:hypothetical protein